MGRSQRRCERWTLPGHASGITQRGSRILLTARKGTVERITKSTPDTPAKPQWARRAFFILFGLALLLLPVLVIAQSGSKSAKEKAKDDGTTKLRIEVTAGDPAEPVEGASVYVRFEEERKFAKDKKVEQNWKTNKEGVIKVPNLPRGKVLVQVIAPGWKTFGQWYDLSDDEQTIKIRLQKPPKWY
jgi:hypothetical protein